MFCYWTNLVNKSASKGLLLFILVLWSDYHTTQFVITNPALSLAKSNSWHLFNSKLCGMSESGQIRSGCRAQNTPPVLEWNLGHWFEQKQPVTSLESNAYVNLKDRLIFDTLPWTSWYIKDILINQLTNSLDEGTPPYRSSLRFKTITLPFPTTTSTYTSFNL
jgi:hypothetical protein